MAAILKLNFHNTYFIRWPNLYIQIELDESFPDNSRVRVLQKLEKKLTYNELCDLGEKLLGNGILLCHRKDGTLQSTSYYI